MRRSALIVGVAALVTVVGGASYAVGTGESNEPGQAQPAETVAASVTAPTEDSFVSMKPCRLVDTRVAGGAIPSKTNRAFFARGSSLGAQGGEAGGCGVPDGASAVSISITAVNETASGWLVGYPADTERPLATSLSYQKGVTETTLANIRLAAPGGHDFRIYLTRTSHVIVDVTGYYAPAMAAFVGLGGDLTFTTGRVVSSTHLSTGHYRVTFDRDVSRCTFQASPYAYNYTVAVGPESGMANSAHVYIHEQVGSTTPHDTSFYIQAVC